jgi:hypothetical protein
VERESPQDKSLRETVLRTLGLWEPYHLRWCKKANHFYSLYRNYQDLKTSVQSSTSPRGQDAIWTDAQGEFGPEMFIPMCFSTVETIVPAMLSNAPEMEVQPRTRASEVNVDNVKGLLEAQQEQSKVPLKLQTVAKDGLITGTGVGKTYWRNEYKKRKHIANSAIPGGGLVVVDSLQATWDDPDFEAVDPQDFIPDPFAERVDKADGAFHRTWRSTAYCKRMVESGQWRNLSIEDDIDGLANGAKYEEVWAERKFAADQINGGSTGVTTGTGERAAVHEVLEFHDGDQIVTILDRKVLVASGANPNWHGELPFQVYRPTEDPHQLHGIGEIEPIEQLQNELNTLRTQRRYNADLVLQRVFAYHEGIVDKEQIQFGPGYSIGVNGDPRELLFPIQVGDIPHSGYEEEDRIGADIDRTSGISDVIAGAGLGGGDTATGVQLVQSAASRRIENKTMRIHLEVINPASEQFVSLSQQRILTNREVRIPSYPSPEEPDRRWSWLALGPQELMGEFEIKSSGTAPENIPQQRADGQMAMTLFGNTPVVDPRKVASYAIGKMGVAHPESWISAPAPTVPAEVLDRLKEHGVPPELLNQALSEAGGPDLLGGQGGQPPVNPEGQPGEGPQPSGGSPAPGESATRDAEAQQPPEGEGQKSDKEPEPAAATS